MTRAGAAGDSVPSYNTPRVASGPVVAEDAIPGSFQHTQRLFSVDKAAHRFRMGAMKFKEKPSMLVLAIYLILVGLIGITGTNLGAAALILPILAIVAGVMILLGR